jgi:ubiquinone/menaquinone biosynthesis C-methylase UbiE
MKVLEVGCGPGSFAEDITGVDLTCLDPSPEMLKVAKRRVDSARNSRGESPADYVQAIAEAIPLPDNTYDRVFCLFSFRDFQDKEKGLEEILRVLKPGGQLVICDAGKANWLHGFAGRIWMSTVVQLMARYVTKKLAFRKFRADYYCPLAWLVDFADGRQKNSSVGLFA